MYRLWHLRRCLSGCSGKKRFVFVQNQRTSMALENIVDTECRRCYACVKACPQVSKATKEFVMGFRRGEKFVHAFAATLIMFLAASGIFMFHYKEALPVWQQMAFILTHSFAGILLLVVPLLYFLLDRDHLKRALKNAFRFGSEDLVWLRSFGKYLKSPGRQPLPSWHEFNTYHKFWFVYLVIVVPLMGLTGIINLIGEAVLGPVLFGFSSWMHFLFALATDSLVLTHIYFKLLRKIFRNFSDMSQCFQQSGTLHYAFLYDNQPRMK